MPLHLSLKKYEEHFFWSDQPSLL